MIYIFGVDHWKVQLPVKENDITELNIFLKKVRDLCKKNIIDLIAEEISHDGLVANNIAQTHLASLAHKLNIEYIQCDPGLTARDGLGIKSRHKIAEELSLSWPPNEIDKAKINKKCARFDRQREEYWLKRIEIYDIKNKNIILVCGFEHVKHFAKLADNRGYLAEIVYLNIV